MKAKIARWTWRVFRCIFILDDFRADLYPALARERGGGIEIAN